MPELSETYTSSQWSKSEVQRRCTGHASEGGARRTTGVTCKRDVASPFPELALLHAQRGAVPGGLLSAKPGSQLPLQTSGWRDPQQVGRLRRSRSVPGLQGSVDGYEIQEEEINAELSLPFVNLGKRWAPAQTTVSVTWRGDGEQLRGPPAWRSREARRGGASRVLPLAPLHVTQGPTPVEGVTTLLLGTCFLWYLKHLVL